MEETGEFLTDEELKALEDAAESDSDESDLVVDETPLPPDAPRYVLRLVYSNETFIAAYTDETLAAKSMVIVPTLYGRDLAQIKGLVKKGDFQNIQKVVRIEKPASPDDLARAAEHERKEAEAFHVCKCKICEMGLKMKLVSVHFLLEDAKIIFFFTAECRIDFRDLVKELVNVFKTRIELRQIGIRDESRLTGGFGICGRDYCCHSISDKLRNVTIKMAKDQNLSLNSMKISGTCGRLLCCLSYEHNFYASERRNVPVEGTRIKHDNAFWRVTEINVILGLVTMSSEDTGPDEKRTIKVPSASFEKADNAWKVRA
jgi:cell fate regulator YaaT (PSP1 superfamily)